MSFGQIILFSQYDEKQKQALSSRSMQLIEFLNDNSENLDLFSIAHALYGVTFYSDLNRLKTGKLCTRFQFLIQFYKNELDTEFKSLN